MTLQYARLFQLRAGILLITEHGPLTRDELAERLRQRKSIEAGIDDATEGADDIITHLRDAHLLAESDEGFRLTTEEDLASAVDNTVLLYAGKAVPGAGTKRAQADRILANLMYEHPMLLQLSKYVYRYGPVQTYELKQQFDGEEFLNDKMNAFTIDMGVNLLKDAESIEETPNGLRSGRWPIRLFAHVTYEEFHDLVEERAGGIRESDLFERLETMYGISRETFDTHLCRLHSAGIISEGSYEEVSVNKEALEGARIHE